MFEVAEGERSSILQNARQTEMGTRGTRPSEYRRQRLARTNLDLDRDRWMRGNAERMKGKAKGLSDRNTCFIYDTDKRGEDLEENLRLSSLILAYLRLMGEKCSRSAFDFQRFGPHGSSLFKLVDATPGLWLIGWTPRIAGQNAEAEGSFYGTSHWDWRGLFQGARPRADGGLVS
jgi:hypothetical protein